MASLIEKYDAIMANGDPRVKDWFMMGSPFPTLVICLSYVYFAKSLGPRLMANRKPFQLKNTLLIYNLVQVIISIYLCYEGAASGWFTGYSWICEPVDYGHSPQALRMTRGCYWYYMSKFIELFDTIFFVLRKKNNQISTLHVIHHGIMPMSVWFGVKFIPGGHSSFFGLLNTFVHIWMYSYYFLAALGPRMQPYLWWKKYLTSLQIIQFVVVLFHQLQALFVDCGYPKVVAWYIGGHALLFLFLFRDFYRKAYDEKRSKEFDVNTVKVDEGRAGIKQSDIFSKNFEHLSKRRREAEAKKGQTSPYADEHKMATGYISDEGLRNRVYINKNQSGNE